VGAGRVSRTSPSRLERRKPPSSPRTAGERASRKRKGRESFSADSHFLVGGGKRLLKRGDIHGQVKGEKRESPLFTGQKDGVKKGTSRFERKGKEGGKIDAA